MRNQYVVVIENKTDCPVRWQVSEVIDALYDSSAEVFAKIAANRWNGKVVSVTRKQRPTNE